MKLDEFIADCDCCFVCYTGNCVETAMVTITVEGLGIDAETAFGPLEFVSETQTTEYSASNVWGFVITCADGVATGTLTSGGNTLVGTWAAIDPVVGCCPVLPADFTSPGNASANFPFDEEIAIEGDGYTGTAILDNTEFICTDLGTTTTPPPPFPTTFPP